MRILAVESATRTLGAAIVAKEEAGKTAVLAEISIASTPGHSQMLIYMIDWLLTGIGMDQEEIDGFAVSVGPGSFTGLRVGMATVKGLVLAGGGPVAAVGTLEALALSGAGWPGAVCPCLDARKGEVYASVYGPADPTAGPGPGKTLIAPGAFDPDDLARRIAEKIEAREAAGPVLFLGDGLDAYDGCIRLAMRDRALAAPPHLRLPRAANVGLIGIETLLAGGSVDIAALAPNYLRRSEAEIADERAKLESSKP